MTRVAAWGQISTEGGPLNLYACGLTTRLEQDRRGTKTEGFLGVAHAACFTNGIKRC